MILIMTGVILTIVGVISLISTILFYMGKKKREIDNIFSSDEMMKGMMNLRHFVDDNKSNFVDVFRALQDKNDPKGDEINLDSGRFFHPFRKKLFNNREKPRKWLLKHTLTIATIKFLIEIVDPLEKIKAAKIGVEHAAYIAKECQKIFKDELEKETNIKS